MANSWPKWKRRAAHIKERLDAGATIQELANEYDVSPKSITNRIGELKADGLLDAKQVEQQIPNDTEVEIMSNGTHKSRKLLEMSEEESKDPDYLLKAHGYSVEDWELVNSRSKIWNVYSKAHNVQTLYSSSITVKPLTNGWSYDELIHEIKSEVKPIHIETSHKTLEDKRMLELSLFDLHWGNARFENYKDSQKRIYELLQMKHWDEVLFVVGSDLFHVDNFKSTTVSGTQLETTDVPSAWHDCTLFYDLLIQTALSQSNTVRIVYIPGNHDSSMGWTYVQYLKAKYPQAQFDDRVKDRKVETYGENFIGLAHGDKARKDLIRIFPAEFPLEWSKTTSRAAHIGHLHREEEVRSKDEFGMTIRTLSTRNPIDSYHDQNGFVTAHRRFMLFEYDLHELRIIHYV